MDSTVLLRPTFGKVVTIAVALVVIGSIASIVASGDVNGVVRGVPGFLLLLYVVWLLFWAPGVRVSPAGVELINVIRTIDISWPEITRIDTKWALEITTDAGRFSAWAAPAPGRHGANRYTRKDLAHLPETAYGAGNSIRPGDTPHSDSGLAAVVVRREWERLRDAGHLDSGVREREHPAVRWHWPQLGILALLVAATAAAALL